MSPGSSVILTICILIVVIDIGYCQVINSPLTYVGDPRHPRVLAQGPPIQISDASQLAHPAVVENSIAESRLPSELLKSHRFYSNPHVAEALARDSWLTDKEAPVFDREAEKIPREQVLKIFKNAGFLQRRKRSRF
ncbi:uncharacterized protein LOC129573466 [Sitodiplosis mosellana]|uniref:uncharacterized protein LOC129573466 n=1 Tax=Sitodiplosis mosellana TaxID=263140 RepID=UPI002444D0FF|nr:uncharacterized protein LOC129573466 [Sitodiplosis mosellana]